MCNSSDIAPSVGTHRVKYVLAILNQPRMLIFTITDLHLKLSENAINFGSLHDFFSSDSKNISLPASG